MTQKPILIAGAGPSSLLLGQSLSRSNTPFKIFERDASLAFRGQGYRLRLSNEGLDAIEAVLGPSWQKFYDRCGKTSGSGTGLVVLNSRTAERIEQPGNPIAGGLKSRDDKVVGIARGEMRNAFFEGIEHAVQFNKHVKSYELVDDGVRAVFADGTKSETGSLLVAGDGVKSTIAAQVSGGALKVYDTGIRGIHGQAPTTAFRGLGEGVFRIQNGNGLAIITNVRSDDMDDPDVQFGWTLTGKRGLVNAPNDDYTTVGKVVADLAKELTKDWHESYRPLFEQINENEAAFWKVTCSTPSGVPVWENEPRVTVIGDAAHCVTPAGGIGANTAVQDAALLGKLIHEAGGYREGLTAEYEEKMRVYASEAVRMSSKFASMAWDMKIDEDTPTIR